MIKKNKNKKIIKIKDYEVKVNTSLGNKILTNRYFDANSVYALNVVQVNQCPICGHTNINMDPWVLSCIGVQYVYLRPNKRAKEFYQYEGNIPNYGRDPFEIYKLFKESKKIIYNTYLSNSLLHDPVEMAQLIITKEEAQEKYG